MKTLAAFVLAAAAHATLATAQAPQAQQQSIPLPPPPTQPAALVPSTEALAWTQKHLAGWPEATRRLGAQLITKYGPPAEVTATQVTWRDEAPWMRITLHRNGPRHNFAAPHEDVLEQVVHYKVPVDRLAELAQFNRSLVPNLTRGELASFSDSEDLNFLALNVADDIIKGERTAEQARTYYAQIVRAKMIREPERYLQGLKFTPAGTSAETADPDEVAPLIRHMSGGDTSGD